MALWNSLTENSVMAKRGPYDKPDKPQRPAWRVNQVKAWRKHRKVTVEKLAELSGLAPGTLSGIENGDVGYSDESLQRIADALKVPRGKLLDEAPPKAAPKVQEPASPQRVAARRR